MNHAAVVVIPSLLATGLLFAAQTPTPYRTEELAVNRETVRLAGTLTMPHGPGPFPAVVLITGSGAQNRDEEVFGFKVFGVLADHLSRNGIAVYRHDDRGVGQSTGNIAAATTADFGDDALAAVARLTEVPEIDKARIGLIGHSEGAVAAAIAASKSESVGFIALLAGPSLPGDVVTRRQATDGARALGADAEAVVKIEVAHRAMTEAVRRKASVDELAVVIKALITAQVEGLPPGQRAMVGDIPAYVEKTFRPHVAQIASPWMRFLMTYDPADALRKVSVPVFAAFGGLDTQVLPELNEGPMREALKANTKVQMKVYPEANHLFQRAKTGLVTEYAALDKTFLPGLLDDVTTWIRTTTRR